MDVSAGLSLVQFVIERLGSPIWNQIEGVLGLECQLDELKETMSTINAVLRDAAEQEHQKYCFTHFERNKLGRLKDALYRADDLVDEILTLANRKKLLDNTLRKVYWRQEMEKILKMLDNIVRDHRLKLGSTSRPSVSFDARQMITSPIKSWETHYFLDEKDKIIGREDDEREVIEKLLNNNNSVEQQDAFVVSIVGIGGLGKTSLAKKIYNDGKIEKKYPQRLWVCVSEDFTIKEILGRILAAVNQEIKTDNKQDLQKDSMEDLQKDLREKLDGKKYLLVLDDVRNEDSYKWLELKNVLIGGGRVSSIIVTTRLKKVADVVGSHFPHWTHELKDLPEDKSLELFTKMALPEKCPMKPELVDTAKLIVRKCAYVPLAVRVVGSLLRDQDESKWKFLIDSDLANIIQDERNDIVPAVLKISYYYLPFHLKSCFSYCAIFPKDATIIKEDLIYLWMAQRFIIPSDRESFEDAGDRYFKQLLQRCFFQDIEVAEGTDEIVSCKMHDLVHDLAKEVAGTDILSCTYSPRCFNEKPRHVYLDRSTPEDLLGKLTKMERMRTCLYDELPLSFRSLDNVEVSKMKYLRVLRLNHARWKMLPSGIDELVHLRYLDLSYNWKLCALPSSITNLYNLQTLKLCGCWSLERLPRELRKLVNLRHLDISGCEKLIHMPPGMNNMASLQKLTMFVVSGSGRGRSNAAWNWRSTDVGQFEDLDGFINHSHTMKIIVKGGVRKNEIKGGGRMLSKSQDLWEIIYEWKTKENCNAEELLQGLQPHYNLRKLELWSYPGVMFPKWDLRNCLPNLVKIKIDGCQKLEHLPLMSQLRHLKVVRLDNLSEVEYMENYEDGDELVFFPSLEKLTLTNMPKLKAWWKSSFESGKGGTREAAVLSNLEIWNCPELTTFPLCPKLENLVLVKFNEALVLIMMETNHDMSSSSSHCNNNNNGQKNKQQHQEGQWGGILREVKIDNVGYLNSLPFHSCLHLMLLGCEWERLRIGDMEMLCGSGRLSSLRSLAINHCDKLKSISAGRGVWEHFTALDSLHLQCLDELELEDEDDVSTNKSTEEGSEVQMPPWRYLAPTLRSLKLIGLPKVVKLPKGIGCLSSLQSLKIMECYNLESLTPSIGGLSSLKSLDISWCPKLKTMPEEMRHLNSLTSLDIYNCSSELKKRCEKHTGIYWPYIQHIPNITVRYNHDLNCSGP